MTGPPPSTDAPPRPSARPAATARLLRRLVQLHLGLVVFGVGLALVVRAELGLDPWNVFHEGLAERTGLGLGWIIVLVSVAVLLLWVPLRQRPGIGTVANALLVGLVLEATVAVVDPPAALGARVAFLVVGILLSGLAIGMYIGAGLGPGPRDGLMTGLAARGSSIRVVRTLIEVGALVGGLLLGGTVGVGTVAYALAIGPIAHVCLPLLDLSDGPEALEGTAPVPADPGAAGGPG